MSKHRQDARNPKVVEVSLLAHHQSAEVLYPRVGAFNCPESAIAWQFASILMCGTAVVWDAPDKECRLGWENSAVAAGLLVLG